MMILCETWIDSKGWEKINMKLPKEYIWVTQWAGRRNMKGRAMGGMIIGVRIGIRTEREKERENKEGMITIKVWLGGEEWKVVGIYVNNDLESWKN